MNAEILAVGTELLMGQIANTNAQYISGRLPEVGVYVYYHSVVGDNPERLKEALKLALSRSDVVVMTGGLGPTKDDLTKETVAESFNRKLVLDNESLESIKGYFKKVGRTMVDSNIKQAYMPEGCIILKNERGTAPGCIIEDNGKTVIMLPGPPSEMKPMFDDVLNYFAQKSSHRLVSKFLRIFGVGESLLEEKIMDLIENQTNPTIAPYAKEGEVTLRVTANCSNNEDPEAILAPTINEIKRRIGESVYSTEDKNLEDVVGELLIENNLTISLAESCTGGLISAVLTDIPGISAVFNRGIVCYSNEAKVANCNVNNDTLLKYGAVSRGTAIEMAKGIRINAGTDIGLSVTGIAGPGGGAESKPVGLVYIALADKDNVWCEEFVFAGNRRRVRNNSVLNALDMIRRYIMKRISINNCI